MPPKAYHRNASSSRLGAQSRATSATKLGTNLQFTQREPSYTNKQPDNLKTKKNALGHAHDTHGRASPFQRVNSSTRVSSRDQLPPYLPSKRAPPPPALKANGTKPKAGFTIASSPQDIEDDEDEWVSSESGAATPNPAQDSDSEAESEVATPIEQKKQPLGRRSSTRSDQTTTAKTYGREKERAAADTGTPLARVDTARPSGHDTLPRGVSPVLQAAATTLEKPKSRAAPSQIPQPSQADPEPMAARTESTSLGSQPVIPRPQSKRLASTRPPSTHSVSSRHDHALRPHPLIRGQSFGVPATISKPAPLAPLTFTSDLSSAQISSSSPVSIDESTANHSPSSTSPTTTVSVSPPSVPQSQSQNSHQHHASHSVNQPTHRRTSVSSARSVATLPVNSVSALREPAKSLRDRHRTLSTISSSSSSAAISSLAHIPVTRPTSPQNVTFPHPSNPVYNTTGLHTLLPPPYLTNHLTVLAHRTPLRESYDRIMRAKVEYRR